MLNFNLLIFMILVIEMNFKMACIDMIKKAIFLEKYSSQSQNGNSEYLYIITYFLSIIKIDVADFGDV